ncbi:MAG: hypothetical protein ACRCUE_11430 [Bosea sp. (in: a-proteobacteria)]
MGRWRNLRLNKLVRGRWTRESGVVVALFGAPVASEAAFLQPEGQTQVISANGVSGFSRDFDANGQIRRNNTFSKTSLDVFAMHGLTETITLVAATSTDRITTKYANDPGSDINWNAMAGVRMPLWQQNGSIVSAQALVGAGRETGRSGLMAEARLMAGHNLSVADVPGFADVQLALRQNAPGARPEMRFDATFGLKPHDRVMLLSQLLTAYGLAHAGQKRSLRVKAQLGVVWHAGETWSVQLSGFQTVYGLNAAQEAGATLGLWRRF